MKKLLLFSLLFTGSFSYSQVIFRVLEPAGPLQGTQDFTWATGATWGTPDFTTPGLYVEDTLAIAEDATTGINTDYGHTYASEGCSAITTNVSGKIAILRRGTCNFSVKAKNCEDAGAVAVIIVNHSGDPVDMGGGTVGPTVTIPVVMVSSIIGEQLITEVGNGTDVICFIGNKIGLFSNDVGSLDGQSTTATYGGAHVDMFNGFWPGIQVYNWGTTNQSNITVNAKIVGPGSVTMYDETLSNITLTAEAADTASIFQENTLAFPRWTQASYPLGDYTLTYTIDAGVTDDSDFDNVYTHTFSVIDNGISYASVDAQGMPIANTFPSNTLDVYKSCMVINDSVASQVGVAGIYFVVHGDTTDASALQILDGSEVILNAYQWNYNWTDLDDPNVDWQTLSGIQVIFSQMNIIATSSYIIDTSEIDDVVFAPFNTSFQLINNQRYLFCAETYDGTVVSFGWDNSKDYQGNEGIYRQPTSPIRTNDDQNGTIWYVGGWSGVDAPAMTLQTIDPAVAGIKKNGTLDVSAYPNPTNNDVIITISEAGNGEIIVTDLSGKVVYTDNTIFANGVTKIDLSTFQSGMYIFNIKMESGATTKFNIVKN